MARWENIRLPVIEKPTARLSWNTHYAALVHEGGESSDIIYPGRPWTDYALSKLDFEKVFFSNLDDKFDLQTAFNKTVDVFIDFCQEAMTSPVWYWPSTTYRYNGQIIPPGDRDIYDTGELFNSLDVEYIGGLP